MRRYLRSEAVTPRVSRTNLRLIDALSHLGIFARVGFKEHLVSSYATGMHPTGLCIMFSACSNYQELLDIIDYIYACVPQRVCGVITIRVQMVCEIDKRRIVRRNRSIQGYLDIGVKDTRRLSAPGMPDNATYEEHLVALSNRLAKIVEQYRAKKSPSLDVWNEADEKSTKGKRGPLAGQKYALSGTFTTASIYAIRMKLISLGAEVYPRPRYGTTALIAGEGTGTKADMARHNAVPIQDEAWLVDLIRDAERKFSVDA